MNVTNFWQTHRFSILTNVTGTTCKYTREMFWWSSGWRRGFELWRIDRDSDHAIGGNIQFQLITDIPSTRINEHGWCLKHTWAQFYPGELLRQELPDMASSEILTGSKFRQEDLLLLAAKHHQPDLGNKAWQTSSFRQGHLVLLVAKHHQPDLENETSSKPHHADKETFFSLLQSITNQI